MPNSYVLSMQRREHDDAAGITDTRISASENKCSMLNLGDAPHTCFRMVSAILREQYPSC